MDIARDHPAIARGNQDRLDGPALRQRSETAGVKSSIREERAPRSVARRAAPRALGARWDRAPAGDFTRLASRLREQGADVFGFGEQKTPESFRQACRKFIYTENLLPEAQISTADEGLAKALQPPTGSYPEYTRARASNVALIESELPWAELAAIPETYATAWTCLFRNLEILKGQTLVIRGGGSSFGWAAINMAVNAGVRVIATARGQDRSATLEELGAERVELEGRTFPSASPRPNSSTQCSTLSATAPFLIP
jgi:hypothetical protein